MRTARGMIGMPVVCGGRRVGRVAQAELTDDLRQLDGVWMSAGFRGARFIPADALELIGSAAVLADGAGERRHGTARPLFRRAISTDGRRLGAITGAQIDEISFAVTALELSSGIWEDLFLGRRWIDRFTVNRETGEVVVDPAGQEMEAEADEGRHVEGPDHGDADRGNGGDGVRRHELADGEALEPAGEEDRQLDL